MTTLIVKEKIAWPKTRIENYRSLNDGEWGYLVFFEGKAIPEFVEERPTDGEILKRWGYALNG